MNTINNQTSKNKNKKIIHEQSDITIGPDGKINISFLWDDLRDIFQEVNQEKTSHLPANNSWTPPQLSSENYISEEYKACNLCPKECGFDRMAQAHPTCGDFKLRVSNIGVSVGDEPEIRGTRGSGIIMLSGCPLTCPSCHNPEKVAHGKETSPEEFFEMCKSLLERGAHNLQILSPTVHLPTLKYLLEILKDSHFPLPIILKSSGYESVEELKKLEGLVDIYLPDFKFGPCSDWGRKAGVKDYFEKAQLALEEMFRQVGDAVYSEESIILKGVFIRHVEAPLPQHEKNVVKQFLSTLPSGIKVSYQDTFVMLE